MKQKPLGLKSFKEMAVRWHSLTDTDPAAAIKEVRALSSDIPIQGVVFTDLKASVLSES